jgi:hypothetical protein
MKAKLLISFTLFFCSWLSAQIPTGQWRLHVSPSDPIEVVSGNNLVYIAFPSGIVEYDEKAEEYTIWNNVNSLSDNRISSLFFDQTFKTLWVGYKNGNIDKIKNNRVTNIPAVKISQTQGVKEITNFMSHSNFIYVSFGLGILKLNPQKNEVVETYYPNNSVSPILSSVILGDTIYALTSKFLYKANLNNPALADPTNWIVETKVPEIGENTFHDMVIVDGKLCISIKTPQYAEDIVFYITSTGIEYIVSDNYSMEINKLQSFQNKLFVNHETGLYVFENNFEELTPYFYYVFSTNMRSKGVAFLGETMYFADKTFGLVQYKNSFDNKKIEIIGPAKNMFYSLAESKGKIAVTSGSIAAAGFTYRNEGAYTFEDEIWQAFNKENQELWENAGIWDVSCAAIHPTEPSKVAFGSYSYTPLSITQNGTSISQLFTDSNSPISQTSLGNGFSCISDLKYDEDGNLWLLNCYSNEVIKMLDKDGNWNTYDCGGLTKSKFTGKLAIDFNGNKWFHVNGVGLVGLNTNNTHSVTSDDKVVVLNGGENTGALPSLNVTAIAVDFNNRIWIGTEEGFAILYNSAGAFDASPGQYNAQRIKLEFEGNVEYMLGSTHITDIEVDGGNRKWVATANTGLFLLSADGLTIEQRLTKENSPLISNNILDIQLNHKTGELFIITDIGLISYRTDATYEDPTYSNVKVFPNPAKPSDPGLITIQGIKYDSDVRITDAAGNLVYKTRSNGGTAVWNGNDVNGNRVETGVYLIWTASNETSGRKIGKVLVIK